jgi:quinoprotein glucose dehydrogenase
LRLQFWLLAGLSVGQGIVIGASIRPVAQPQATTRSVRDGAYTAEQAKRGENQYQQDCSSCHGATLEGSEAGTALIGTDFIGNWTGKTVADLFDYVRSKMPKDSPGRLSRQEYADVIAYILGANLYPEGRQELKSDAETLQQIRIEAP